MYIKKINPFINTGKVINFYHLVDLIKTHYEKELEETDRVYSKMIIDKYVHLSKFNDELYFCFKDDIEYQCEKYNIEYRKNEQFLNYYFKALDLLKEEMEVLFNKYYPIEECLNLYLKGLKITN
ncbi:hypothetical protein [Flavobacterium branchiophilum]|uniref:Uncharacterized protein n=1 Tax=Flavobacterium branchiophilum TaxID=55197 RepID=A0A2H3KX65_9FLAO|nr:hypothetical protein [Flavobacterium branchiophilum]PDS25495.1 hypothetical protein B0A77_04880 [Flavobacterium branchiophilum]